MKGRIRKLLNVILVPLAQKLLKIGFTPNFATLTGFFFNILAAIFIGFKNHIEGGILILVGGFFDILDGILARELKINHRFGALFDSSIDRFSEAIIFLGILVYVFKETSLLYVILVIVALIGSFMVSYVRARAEGLGFKCEVGLLTRVERVVILGVCLILRQLPIALWIIAILANLTAIHRLIYIWQKEKKC